MISISNGNPVRLRATAAPAITSTSSSIVSSGNPLVKKPASS